MVVPGTMNTLPMCLSNTPLISSCCVQNRIINNTLSVYHWSLVEVQYNCKLFAVSDGFPPQGLVVSVTFLQANIIVC